MLYSELKDQYISIQDLIFQKKIAGAFESLRKLADQCRNSDYRNRLENNLQIYQNVLKYSFEEGGDPEKEKVYRRLLKSLVELNDEVREELIVQNHLLSHYNQFRYPEWEREEVETGIRKWIDRYSLRMEAGEQNEPAQALKDEEDEEGSENEILNNLFSSVWLSDKLTESQITLLKDILANNTLSWHFRSLATSSITLSALRHFDIEKMNLLFEYYQEQEHQVRERALVGILLILYIHHPRIHLYPEVIQRLKAFGGSKSWNKSIEMILIQFLRARETEKIAEKLREEIIPELIKSQSKFTEKLNMDELLKENMLEDKNPEWENFFEDSPDLYDKIEEFSNLQMEGADVFLSAFAMLKRFDFFNKPGNWFLPFYGENELIMESFGELKEGFDIKGFLSGLQNTRFLCNSDKYSFCLNAKHMPSVQRSMIVEFFNMELEAMNDMAGEDSLAREEVQSRTVIIQYVQDLYRFFRLNSFKKEIEDVFDLPLDFHNMGFFRQLVDDPDLVRNIAEFYFEKDHMKEALSVFISLEKDDKGNELAEKAAYCYQQLGDYPNALEYYKKAELSSKPRTWLLNKIAFCYRRLGNPAEAVDYYKQSEKIDPENLYIQTSLGQVYLDMEEYETALKYFYKVEYLAPDNIKVQRPIGWCSFVLGKHDNARKYFEKVILKEGNQYDFMNLGHVFWVTGDRKSAIENYRESIKKAAGDYEWFSSILEEDSRFLRKFEIPGFDIPLMLDYLKMYP